MRNLFFVTTRPRYYILVEKWQIEKILKFNELYYDADKINYV